MTKRYRVTPRALQDLLAIGRYTEAAWGKAKRDSYLRQIERRFVWLSQNPALGRRRDEIGQGYRCFPEGQHLVFYLVAANEIQIIGIPHQSMDISGFFKSESI